jgi:hypothetical protein
MTTALDGLPKKALLTPREVADFFRVDVDTIYTWRAEGKITGLKISHKALRIPRDEVLELIIISRAT